MFAGLAAGLCPAKFSTAILAVLWFVWQLKCVQQSLVLAIRAEACLLVWRLECAQRNLVLTAIRAMLWFVWPLKSVQRNLV